MTASSTADTPGSFHEWPLVLFTTLAIMGAGLLATPLVAWLAAGTPAPAAAAIPWGALLLGTGLLVSLAHLGRPLRAPLVWRGIGRSRLSAEIAAGGTALVLGVTTAALPYVSPTLDVLTGLAAVAFVVALGLVYNLPGQQTWRGPVVWMPLSAAAGFGAVSLMGIWGEAVVALGALAAAALAADTVLLLARRLLLVWPREPLSPRYPALFARQPLLLAARFALVDILPGVSLFAGHPLAAAVLLALGIFVDRLAFYGLACQRTTEAEVQNVEGLLAVPRA